MLGVFAVLVGGSTCAAKHRCTRELAGGCINRPPARPWPQVEEQPTSAAAGDAVDAASPAGAGAAGSGGEGTPFAVQLRSLEQRVAGMGGIPGEQLLPALAAAAAIFAPVLLLVLLRLPCCLASDG